jgi:MFS family permease
MRQTNAIKAYPYRWIVLVSFMFITLMTQLLWITFAPITSAAAQYYGKSDLWIGLLSMSFMIVYMLVVLPSAWIIDTRGFRRAVGIGSVITAACALTRGIFGSNFALVFVSQIGIALGQPLVLGSITKLAAKWFPVNERATATGLGTLAIYLGILVGMIATPVLTLKAGIVGMLWLYGALAAAAAVGFLLLAKAEPPTPPCASGQEERTPMFDGLKAMVHQRDFILLLVIFFIGLGMFNGVSTWIEVIVRARGFSITQAGMLGGLMLIGGILGAIVVPLISDGLRRRKPFITMALALLIPGLLGITFASSYWLLLLSGFAFGFFLLSAGPIGFQYGAEITHPAPEGTSNSLLIVMGQVSGIVFIFAMDAFKSSTDSMTPSLLVLAALTVLGALLSLLLKESPLHSAAKAAADGELENGDEAAPVI